MVLRARDFWFILTVLVVREVQAASVALAVVVKHLLLLVRLALLEEAAGAVAQPMGMVPLVVQVILKLRSIHNESS
jgi:endonuclease/exonuclease/phosphatase (EEP) superfamily protein YafD